MTEFIENICVKSDTLIPNTIVYGSPTISNGVVSNFSASNYLDIVNGKQDNNAEYVIKFTTGSTTKTTTQSILTAQNFLTIEIASADAWTVLSYNWETSTNATLFTATANTTYWIKILVNNKTKTISYSTDGTTYTQVASFTDNAMDITNSYPLRIGNHSSNALLYQRAFLGSVDLNETYINVNGKRFWDGTDYKKYLPIGGDIADGKFIGSNSTIYSGKPSYSFYKTINISNYLPNDNYDYEVIFNSHLYTGATSGNYVDARIASGTKNSSNFSNATSLTGGRINTRTASVRETACSGILPIHASDRNISLFYSGSGTIPSSNSNNIALTLNGYRRIGKNTIENNTSKVASICVSSNSKIPCTLVYGTPNISNGVVSNFSGSNYLDIPNGKYNNAEYVIKFTTPSSTTTASQAIFHSEYFLALQVTADSYVINCYNWADKTTISLFTATANTTYWVKILVNGQIKTFSYSTDGTNYTQVANFTDTTMDASLDYKLRLGMSSLRDSNYTFHGSIDLNECYINVNGERVWEGMDYKKYLPIGGKIFEGQWVNTNFVRIASYTYTAGTTYSYNLKSLGLIPNDNYQYEVIVSGWCATGTTSGNWCGVILSSTSLISNMTMNYANTRTANKTDSWKVSVIPLSADGILRVYNNATSGVKAATELYLCGYRRIGLNE